MALQTFNWANLPVQESPYGNLIEDIFKGYQIGRAPEQMNEEQLKRQLANKLSQMEVEHKPTEYSLSDALKQAQIQKALRPPLSTIEKALAGAQRIKGIFGENSPEYKAATDYVNKIAQGSGTQFSVDPSTGVVTFSQGTGSRGGVSMQIVDGKLVQRPTQPTATAMQKGSVANVLRETTAKHIDQPYKGSGANAALFSDRLAYNLAKDPKKKKAIGEKLIKAAVADKLKPEYALQQLLAQNTPATIPAIHEQIKAITQGWAEGLGLVVNNLPPELQEKAKERHDKAIEEINKARNKFIAQGLPIELEDGDQKIVATKTIKGKEYFQNDKGEWFEK